MSRGSFKRCSAFMVSDVDVPSVISYDKLLEAIQMKLEACEIGSDTEYLADLIITLESRIRLTHAMKQAYDALGGAVVTTAAEE